MLDGRYGAAVPFVAAPRSCVTLRRADGKVSRHMIGRWIEEREVGGVVYHVYEITDPEKREPHKGQKEGIGIVIEAPSRDIFDRYYRDETIDVDGELCVVIAEGVEYNERDNVWRKWARVLSVADSLKL